MLIHPFCPFTTARIRALRAMVLPLQTLLFLAVSGGLSLLGGAALLSASQQRRPASA